MSKKSKGSTPKPYPTDSEAAAGAQTARKPSNLEEQRGAVAIAAEDLDDIPNQTGVEGTQPIPTVPKAPLAVRLMAAATGGFCDFCNAAVTPDPRKTHRCARCRRELVNPKAE